MAKAKTNRVSITLPRARKGEAAELYVAINGVEYLIPRGKPVQVPDFVAAEIERSTAAEIRKDEETERMLEESRNPRNM